jgi:hypothetical protein
MARSRVWLVLAAAVLLLASGCVHHRLACRRACRWSRPSCCECSPCCTPCCPAPCGGCGTCGPEVPGGF